MTEFLRANLDYVLFIYGTGLVLLAMILLGLGVTAVSSLPWKWLGVSAALVGLGTWTEMLLIALGPHGAMESLRVGLFAGGCAALLEFARIGWDSVGGARVGRWVVGLLLVVAALCGIVGVCGFDVAAACLLGVPGGLWGAAVLWRFAAAGARHGRPLMIAAVAMGLFVVADCVVSVKVSLPRAWISQQTFLEARGLVQLVGLACLSLMLGGIFAHSAALRRDEHPGRAARRGTLAALALAAALALILLGGFYATTLIGRSEDSAARADLSARTALAASAIDPTDVASLLTTEFDVSSLSYSRLRDQLTFMKRVSADVRSFRLLDLQEGRILFAVDGAPLGDSGHSLPGTRYRQPPAGLANAWVTARPFIVGPYSDEFGTSVSGFAVIWDTKTLRVVGVLGLSMDAAVWARVVTEHRLAPILLTLLLALIVITSYVLQERLRLASLSLADSESEYRSVLEGMHDVFYRTDASGDLVMASPSFACMFGFDSVDEALGMNLARDLYVDSSDREVLLRHLMLEGAVADYEVRVHQRDGSIIYGSMSGDVRRGPDGKVIGVEGVLRDITERKRAEEAVAAAEERARLLLQSAADGIFGTDHDGHVTFMNAAAEEMLGWSAAELRGLRMHDAIHYAYADRTPYPVERCPQHAAYTKGVESAVNDEVMWRKDGSCFPVEYSARPLLRGGAVTGSIVTFRDITVRKSTEEAIQHAKEQTEAANRDLELAIKRANELAVEAAAANSAKGEFLANMSHEIRTPMNGVMGMTTLLLDSDLDDEQRDFALTVQNSAESLLTIINDILDFSKIEAGKLAMETLDFDLRTTVEDTCELPALNAHERGLELTLLMDPDVPSALRGDPGRLRQVLTNMIGNAVKFTEQGEVALAVELESETVEVATLRFKVRDTGIGIAPEKIERLFEAFTQADASTTRRFGGTGLGLTISRRLVELMGGEIGVQSEVGVGSTFWFTATFAKREPLASADGGSERESVDISGAHILAVDDNETNRKVVAGMLESWGCRHEEVGGAAATLEAMRRAEAAGDPYRIVILDMMMPDADGEELGATIKGIPELAGSELVMMTSMGSRGDAGRLEAIGFAAYLSKPVKRSQLFDCLVVVLDRGSEQPRQGEGRAPIITRHALAERGKRRMRILLAEDNPVNQRVVLKTLEKMGYGADAVANGSEALDALAREPYDLVLMDVQMSEMDGVEATRRIRDGGSVVRDHGVPIVALTAHAMAEDREACLAAGMDDYLSKPLRPDELARVLAQWTGAGPVGELMVGASKRARARAATVSPAPPEGSAEASVFDEDVLLKLLSGDRGAVAEIMGEFLVDVPRQIEALRLALAAGDLRLVRRQAHTVKGAAANVGAEALRAAAYRLERVADDGDQPAAFALGNRLDLEFARLCEVLDGGKARS